MGSVILAIVICLVAGFAVVVLAVSGVGSGCFDGCATLFLLLAIGAFTLLMLALFGVGCMTVLAAV